MKEPKFWKVLKKPPPDNNAWHHVAIVKDNSNGSSVYVDGVLHSTVVNTTSIKSEATVQIWCDTGIDDAISFLSRI